MILQILFPYFSPPFVHKAQNGGISYFHGSSQGQLVIESYIVMVLSKFPVLFELILFTN